MFWIQGRSRALGLHGGIVRSHRLELMRQIYNMNESAYDEEEQPPALPAPPAPPAAAPPDILQCISACAQQTRLSLANLLPSRFVTAAAAPQWTTLTHLGSSNDKKFPILTI